MNKQPVILIEYSLVQELVHLLSIMGNEYADAAKTVARAMPRNITEFMPTNSVEMADYSLAVSDVVNHIVDHFDNPVRIARDKENNFHYIDNMLRKYQREQTAEMVKLQRSIYSDRGEPLVIAYRSYNRCVRRVDVIYKAMDMLQDIANNGS